MNGCSGVFSQSQDEITIYLIRHGESTHNLHGNIVGGRSSEVLLTDNGRTQATKLAKALAGIHFDAVFTSPTARARHTAAIALGGHEMLHPTEQTGALHEMSQGIWEGISTREVLTPEVWEEIRKDPYNWVAPSGESQADVELRVHTFVEKEILPRSSGTFVFFTHAWTIRCFLRPIIRRPASTIYDLAINNASITEVAFRDGKWWFSAINNTDHLR